MKKIDNTTNSLNWFEIPVLDIERSKKFYATIFDIELEVAQMDMGDSKMVMFPFSEGTGKATGGLVQGPDYKPSTEGSLIYMNANPDLTTVIEKVEAAGGKILAPKMSIGEHGNIAFILDTEGNKIGLHSVQ